MSTRPQLTATRRQVTGKAVSRLRREGQLPAVLYGHGHESEALQFDAKAFDTLRRKSGRNALVDLTVESSRPLPVMIHAIQEHPVGRQAIHVDLFVVKMTEEMTIDVPVTMVGESLAATRLGGTLLHFIDAVRVRALPGDLPQNLELDITALDSFDAVLHVSDINLPPGVTLVTDASEPLARVQAPRLEEEPTVAEAPEEPAAEVPEGAAADEDAS